MPIETVAVDEAIRASTQNKLIANANGSPGRAIFTSNGSWSVPAGVYRFKVYLAGGGGAGGDAWEYFGSGVDGGGYRGEGGRGGNGPLCSRIFSGYEPGTTFLITIGAGAVPAGPFGVPAATPAAASTFGTVLTSNPGGNGTGGTVANPSQGAQGSHNGQIVHTNQLFLASQNNGYGEGGQGGNATHPNGFNGNPGICVIEW